MRGAATVWMCFGLATAVLAVSGGAAAQSASPSGIAAGGKLYDKWWKAAPGAKEPAGNHPMWALQTTNKRKGLDTWRCKECHGWDYRGKDGVYGSGSHKTGFPGLLNARSKSMDQLKAALKGSANPRHDFSPFLDDGALTDLANFLKFGLVDLSPAIDPKTKRPVKADVARGKQLFPMCGACHGADGKKLNFGKPDDPEYVGTVASENPWEFLHKVRSGQPGSNPSMPSGVETGWNLQDVLDILAYAQTLPEK